MCFLTDMAHLDEINEAYGKFYPNKQPACTMVAVSNLPKPGAVFEMECIFFKP